MLNGQPAHRLTYEAFVSPIPSGLVIDHKCRVRCCVNPEHLEPVSNSENCKRGVPYRKPMRMRTHCPNGHSYDEVGYYVWQNKRRCKECQRAKWKTFKTLAYRKRFREKSRIGT